jgi:hypothetical protein
VERSFLRARNGGRCRDRSDRLWNHLPDIENRRGKMPKKGNQGACMPIERGKIMKAKTTIKQALTIQKEGKGFSLVEAVSICPTNWGKTPTDAHKWLTENMLPVFPLGIYKYKTGIAKT